MFKKFTAIAASFALAASAALPALERSGVFTAAAAGEAEAFLDSYNTETAKNVGVLGTDSIDSFEMYGRTYYQGIRLKATYLQGDCNISYNVTNVGSVSFTVGHLDESNDSDKVTLIVYLDGVSYEEVSLSPTMTPENFTIDTTEAGTLQFFIDNVVDDIAYAIGDVTVDGVAPARPSTAPVYDSAAAFLDSEFNFSGSGTLHWDHSDSKAPSYQVNGADVWQGITFSEDDGDSSVCYNVTNVDSVSFTVGHLDNSSAGSATLLIYLDGGKYDEIPLSYDMSLTECTIDTTDVDTLRLYMDRVDYTDSAYTLCDVTITTADGVLGPVKGLESPTYDSAEAFLDSGFNHYGGAVSVHHSTSKVAEFKMNGNEYWQGLLFENSSTDSQISFNVTNVDSVSFTIGHVDNEPAGATSLYVYLDGAEYDVIELETDYAKLGLEEYTVDTTDVDVLKLSLDHENYQESSWAFCDVSITTPEGTLEAAKGSAAPKHETVEDFLDSGFNQNGGEITIHHSTHKVAEFQMNGEDYWQGVKFAETTSDSGISYNVNDIDSVSFTLGHVDGSDTGTGTLYIYLDGGEYDAIPLTEDMEPIDYTIDTTGVEALRFYLDRESGYTNSSYALGKVAIVRSGEQTQTTPSETTTTTPSETTTTTTTTTTSTTTTTITTTTTSAETTTTTSKATTATAAPTETTTTANTGTTASAPEETTTTLSTATANTTDTETTTATAELTTTTVPTETTASSTDTTTPTTPSETMAFGDVDNSGNITIDDATMTLQVYTNLMLHVDAGVTDDVMKAMDLDEDGAVTIDDATYILAYYTAESVTHTPMTWYEITGNPNAPGAPK